MEIQLRLKGHSEGFILQSKSDIDDDWFDRLEIVQEEECYRLQSRSEDILVFKRAETISQTERIAAQSITKGLSFLNKCDLTIYGNHPIGRGFFDMFKTIMS